MDKIVINGGRRLSGRVDVDGAKNAALPLVFASLLSDQPCRLRRVPPVADLRTAKRLLEKLGASVAVPEDGVFEIDCSQLETYEAPYDLVRTMRASFLTLGPLVARFGRARVSKPGGCAIGSRPVDIHLAGLHRMGVRFRNVSGYIEAECKRLEGAHVILEMPSVGATENLMMAAALAHGTTRLENAAREPEIVDLAGALTQMGANIEGAGSSVVEIEGVDRLEGFDHVVIPDRIEAGTYLIAATITRGEVVVNGARADHLAPLLEALESAGVSLDADEHGIGCRADARARAVDLATAPYPGFPTDLQAQFMAFMCLASGTSQITETIFENRFMHVNELERMGADIRLQGANAYVTGRVALTGAPVMATDLRASVCLVLAGLAAESRTEILRVYHLDRGYRGIERKLSRLGADIARVRA